MAATYTEVTIDEMDKFLKRGWRTLRPKQGVYKGETCYDLFLSPHVSVRVLTSISARRSSGAGVGEDAIRVSLFMPKKERPMLTGKMPIVKRTQGWKTNLQDRIEDFIEMYEDREGYFEGRAGGEVPKEAPQESALDGGRYERDEDEGNRAEREMAEAEMRHEEAEQARQEALQRREEEIQRREEEERAAPTPRPTNLQAMYRRLPNGDWGLQVEGEARPGDRVLAVTKGGQKQYKIVGEVVSTGQDRYTGKLVTLTTIANPRTANEEPIGEEEEVAYSYERGA